MPLVDLVGGDLPLPVGGGQAVGVPPSDVDVFVDRVPFWLAIAQDSPYQRETAQFQRDQVDQQPEAGEQTLAGWWTRSQMSFHMGAGLDYLDTSARPDPADRLRYKTSRNVDVWVPGQVTRLNGTTLARPATAGQRVWTEQVGSLLITARDNAVEVYDGTTWVTRNYGSAQPIRAFCTDGVNYYAAALDGVWTAPVSGTATATKAYTLPGTDVPMVLGYSKQRLVLGHTNSVYVLDTAGPALPTAKLTHKLPSWAWTAITDVPNGICVAGFAGQQSAVYRFEESDVSGVPTLGAGLCLLQMPNGEPIRAALLYLGAFLVLGTDRGIRVCPFSSYWGTVTLGPLTTDALHPTAFTALGGYDRFIYGGTVYNGETQLVRVDLSAPLDQNGHYAWAPDLVFPTGLWTTAPSSIAFRPDGRLAVGVTGQGVVLEDTTTDGAQTAWLQTARMRMGTVEAKHWIYGTIRGTFSDTAAIGVSVQDPSDLTTFASVYVALENGERFALISRATEWIALRFDMAEDALLSSYQVQALPGGKRQRLIQLPVAVSDYQRTRSQVRVGYDGWGLERLAALEHLEETGSTLTVSAPALFPEAITGIIERLTFVQTADMGDSDQGTGGILQIVLRTTG